MAKYFGTDGVRGEANKTLTTEIVNKIGRYLGDYYQKNGKGKIIVAKDTRLSSDMFESCLTSAIISQGCDVYLLSFATTPALAYLISNQDFDCGIMISASHNPYQDNGIKIFGTDGLKIKDDLELPIESYMDDEFSLDYVEASKIGRVYDYSKGIDDYIDWLCKEFPLDLSKIKIALDLCNGGACFTAKKAFSKLNANYDVINDSPDGININYNCGSTHLEAIKDFVKQGNYDIGFAFDGDADRVLAIDSNGEEIDGDKIMYVLAKQLKQEGKLKGNKLVTTVMSNIGLKKALQENDIDYEIVAVGDKNVVECLRNNDYVVGGEQSGHIINTYTGYFGDGLKTALNLLQVIVENDKSINELSSAVKVYPQLLRNIRVTDKQTVQDDDDIKNKINEIADKLKDEGRILVRPSGTEPLLRVMVEAKTDDICEELVSEVIQLIKDKGYEA